MIGVEKKPFWLHYNSIKLIDSFGIDEFGWHNNEPGYFKEESRSNNIIHFVYSGVCKLTVWEDDKPIEFELHSGDAFIVNQGVRHKYQSDFENPCGRYWISCSGAAYVELLKNIGFSSHYEIVYGLKTENIYKCFQKLKNNMESSTISVLSMYSCVFELLRNFAKSIVPQEFLLAKERDNIYLDSVAKYIDNNLMEDLKVQTIAKQFGYDRTYLYKIFKKKYKISIKQYIDEKRILKARTLVVDTDKPFKEIAYEVGFEDYSAFLKLFTKICKQSPEKYKKAFEKYKK